MTRPIAVYSYYLEDKNRVRLGTFFSAVPLHIGDKLVYKGNLMKVTNANDLTVYVKKIDSVIHLHDSPRGLMRCDQ